MFDLFWVPTNYSETIEQLAQLNSENRLDQKTIDFVLKRISNAFGISDTVSISMDIFNRTLELERVKT